MDGMDRRPIHKFRRKKKRNKLVPGIQYYDMEARTDTYFQFCFAYPDSHYDDCWAWWDPKSYEDCNWLFASPCVFPRVPDLPPPFEEDSTISSSMSAGQRTFFTIDLLYLILHFAAPYVSPEPVDDPGKEDYSGVSASLKTVLNMALVNKHVYNAIIQGMQALFFRFVWQFDWMLPDSPKDWKSWNAVNDPLPPLTGVPMYDIPGRINPDRKTLRANAKDWRAYLLMYLKKAEPHARNRQRFHRMCIQFAQKGRLSCEREVGTALEGPGRKKYAWEAVD
eukprot:GHVU01125617.1.p1 GENE.GHVU01125617.1~~GHVU01125617.1.p1  ORF type:complete len:279 (+),score=21.84 GHVU01125617.1:434-1270(+)